MGFYKERKIGKIMEGGGERERERNSPKVGSLKETKRGERNCREKVERGDRKCDFESF